MLVVPDIQDVYTPRQTDLLVPLTEVIIFLTSLYQRGRDLFLYARLSLYQFVCLDSIFFLLLITVFVCSFALSLLVGARAFGATP